MKVTDNDTQGYYNVELSWENIQGDAQEAPLEQAPSFALKC